MHDFRCSLGMSEDNKYIPNDSEADAPKKGQVVKQPEDKVYKRLSTDMKNPAKVKKYSEQPPTKRNAKT